MARHQKRSRTIPYTEVCFFLLRMWYCCLCFVDIVDIDVDDDGYVVEKGADDDDNDGVADANDFVDADVKADTMM